MATDGATEGSISYHCFIEHDEDEKYILVEIATQNAKQKKWAVVSKPLAYHKEIVGEFEMDLRARGERLFMVHGGGVLKINRTKKSIKTYGTSAGYGDPDRDLVEKILRLGFPDYRLDITVTEYIRVTHEPPSL